MSKQALIVRIAILDDYQGVSLSSADWSPLHACEISVFRSHFCSVQEATEALTPFDVVCLMRERMAVPRELIENLPNLKFIAATGPHNRTIDYGAARERGIVVSHTPSPRLASQETVELTWGLILGLARNITREDQNMRAGGWQGFAGTTIQDKTLGLLGFGKLGARVASIGAAFGMRVIAWSPNLTKEAAESGGAIHVSKDELFAQSDFVSIHLVLGDRSRGAVSRRELALMKNTAYLVNTSRGPIVDEGSLILALKEKWIAGAALDVFDIEPLPVGHRLRTLDNVLLTPHLGYVTVESLNAFYSASVENISAFLSGVPIRVANSACS